MSKRPSRYACFLIPLLAGCQSNVSSNAVPEATDIERLESRLSRHPCIGRLADWERNYRYSRKTGMFSSYSLNPDLDVIEFHLRRAGATEIRPGRNIMPAAPGGDWPDSSPIQSIDGKFTLGSGSLAMSRCQSRTP